MTRSRKKYVILFLSHDLKIWLDPFNIYLMWGTQKQEGKVGETEKKMMTGTKAEG